MKCVLRVLILGPLMVVAAAGMTLVYPLWRFLYWMTEDHPPNDPHPIRGIWKELVGDLW